MGPKIVYPQDFSKTNYKTLSVRLEKFSKVDRFDSSGTYIRTDDLKNPFDFAIQ